MVFKRILVGVIAALVCVGCNYQLYPPTVVVKPTFGQYRYAYIVPTGTVTAGVSGIAGFNGYVWGDGYSTSVSPSEVIAGDLMQRGYAILPEINDNFVDKTLIVSFGELGTRSVGLEAYTKEIIIQFRDARTGDLVCSGQAEGLVDTFWHSYTETDATKYAIKTALDSIFEMLENSR